MADEKPKNLNSLPSGYEGRLQHVEQVQADHGAQLARFEVGLQHSMEKVEAGFAFLGEKIDSIVAPIAAQQKEHDQHLKALGDVVAEQADGLKDIQEATERRRQRWSTAGKYLVPIFTGAAAIGIKELVAWLVR